MARHSKGVSWRRLGGHRVMVSHPACKTGRYTCHVVCEIEHGVPGTLAHKCSETRANACLCWTWRWVTGW